MGSSRKLFLNELDKIVRIDCKRYNFQDLYQEITFEMNKDLFYLSDFEIFCVAPLLFSNLREARCISDDKYQKEIEADNFLRSLLNDTKTYLLKEKVCCFLNFSSRSRVEDISEFYRRRRISSFARFPRMSTNWSSRFCRTTTSTWCRIATRFWSELSAATLCTCTISLCIYWWSRTHFFESNPIFTWLTRWMAIEATLMWTTTREM